MAQTVINNTSAKLKLKKETNYQQIRDYTNNNQRIDVNAISQLQRGLEFRQIRYFCYRRSVGRRLHIMTTMDSHGDDVLRYFISDPRAQPTACGSFVKLPDDTSILASHCQKWGHDGQSAECNKWGYYVHNGTYRIYQKPAFWHEKYYYSIIPTHLLCDENETDNQMLSIGDSWKVFVR